jgi:hypothetical protein
VKGLGVPLGQLNKMATSNTSPPPTPGSDGSERKTRITAAEEFFQAYRFDDTLPLKLDIIDEKKTKKGAVSAIFIINCNLSISPSSSTYFSKTFLISYFYHDRGWMFCLKKHYCCKEGGRGDVPYEESDRLAIDSLI